MIQIILATKDRATDAYAQPFFVLTKGQAMRGFQDEVNRADDNNALNKHADDFELYIIGLYDSTTGEITGCAPELLARAKDLLR